MIKHMELYMKLVDYGETIFRKEKSIKTLLQRTFDKSQRHVNLLSVHGSMTFNTWLLDAIPDNTAFTNIQCELRNYRSKAQFDMLFYSHPKNTKNSMGDFLEDLCYCRMLLSPGGFLFLVAEGKIKRNIASWPTKEQNSEVVWLRQAGLVNITTPQRGNGFIFTSGQRPCQSF